MDGLITNILLPVAIAIIMFSLGLGLTNNDFKKVIKSPRDFFVGLTSQIIILPIVAFIIVLIFLRSSPELAVGIMLIAAAPGGATSNLYTFLAKGDVALSVSLTLITSLICVITIPLIATSSYHYFVESNVSISVIDKIIGLFIIITIPTIIGMIFKYYFTETSAKIENFTKILSIIILFLIIFYTIYELRNEVFDYFRKAGFVTLVLNIVMMIIAFYIGKYLISGIKQAKCITLECGLQNGTIAIFVANSFFDGGIYLIPAATYSLIMFITALIFVYFVRNKS